MRRTRSFLLAFLAFLGIALGAETAASPSLPASLVGRWEGRLLVPRPDLGQGRMQSDSFALRILSEGYALVDLPERNIFGFPVTLRLSAGDRLSFGLGAGPSGLRFEGGLLAEPSLRLSGEVAQGAVSGSWMLEPKARGRDYGESLGIAVRGGELRGSLLLPSSPAPLVILVAGSGQTDRDGNNYQVPGRSDSFRLLASALVRTGVASFRYDRRGVGESIALAPDESSLRFEDEIADLGSIVDHFGQDPRFSSLVLVGQSDGALVAASLLVSRGRAVSAGLKLAILATGATSALDSFRKAIDGAPTEQRSEGRAILAAVLAGRPWPHPSPYYADFFRPSFQAYLTGWLNRDLKSLLPKVTSPLLLVQGDRDMQVELGDFLPLAAIRPEAAAVVVPDMNHVLKSVPAEVDANYASFSNPDFPVAEDLVVSIAAFAKGESLPAALIRVDGGILPGNTGSGGFAAAASLFSAATSGKK
ncbi:MAG TPA: alpha/beta fold hydrolase [Rectinemataceae bacterium]|nr:alpha/beta fold hydrolase [Rectinemataceae bacterium]